jgi:hypothetical protein
MVHNTWYFFALKSIDRTLDKNCKLQGDNMLGRKVKEIGAVKGRHGGLG